MVHASQLLLAVATALTATSVLAAPTRGGPDQARELRDELETRAPKQLAHPNMGPKKPTPTNTPHKKPTPTNTRQRKPTATKTRPKKPTQGLASPKPTAPNTNFNMDTDIKGNGNSVSVDLRDVHDLEERGMLEDIEARAAKGKPAPKNKGPKKPIPKTKGPKKPTPTNKPKRPTTPESQSKPTNFDMDTDIKGNGNSVSVDLRDVHDLEGREIIEGIEARAAKGKPAPKTKGPKKPTPKTKGPKKPTPKNKPKKPTTPGSQSKPTNFDMDTDIKGNDNSVSVDLRDVHDLEERSVGYVVDELD